MNLIGMNWFSAIGSVERIAARGDKGTGLGQRVVRSNGSIEPDNTLVPLGIGDVFSGAAGL